MSHYNQDPHSAYLPMHVLSPRFGYRVHSLSFPTHENSQSGVKMSAENLKRPSYPGELSPQDPVAIDSEKLQFEIENSDDLIVGELGLICRERLQRSTLKCFQVKSYESKYISTRIIEL
jgi:hypothetical protein